MLPQNTNRDPLTPRVFTIGHSNYTMDHFLGLLKMHGIEVVVDVRSRPYSKYARHFDKDPLKLGLQSAGIRHLYLGRELGGRPEADEFYDQQGHVLYDRVAATDFFQEGLARLKKGVREFQVAMLCAEENPSACHRRLLVSRMLLEDGFQVEHIRGDGRLQTEEEVIGELNPNGDQLALFQKHEEASWKSISLVSRKKRSENSSTG